MLGAVALPTLGKLSHRPHKALERFVNFREWTEELGKGSQRHQLPAGCLCRPLSLALFHQPVSRGVRAWAGRVLLLFTAGSSPVVREDVCGNSSDDNIAVPRKTQGAPWLCFHACVWGPTSVSVEHGGA